MSSRKKKSPTIPSSSAPSGSASTAPSGSSGAPIPRRIWVFAALDALFAALYIGVTRYAHSADGRFETLTWIMGLAILAAGVGIAARQPWGWWTSVIGCGIVLAGAITLMTLLAMSLGFLWGSFGALGKGAASMSLIMIALIVECYVLLPAFQLAWLLSPAGRRSAGRPVRASAGSEAHA